MVTEIVLLLPLCILWYAGYINWIVIITIVVFCYWLPKWFFISLLAERLYPNIVVRNNLVADKFIGKVIALTFDDVPYGDHARIIKLLDKYSMKGTFFVISGDIKTEEETGIRSETYGCLVDAVKKGHQLGNHGKTDSMHAIKSNESLEYEISHCDTLIKQIYKSAEINLPTNMVYRPGCGAFTTSMLRIANRLGYKLALGSVYPNDPIMISSLINYYYLINHIEKGDIVILHDRTWTVPLLEMLLPWLTENNYTSVTVDILCP
jgi:peptidoglycan/xylan/chitin deacetylase (PgdA/CDA1 family)